MADEEVSHVRSRDASSAPKEQPEVRYSVNIMEQINSLYIQSACT